MIIGEILVSIGIAVLAVLQGVFGVMRPCAFFRIGGELAGQGIILIPLVRAVVYGRGGLIILLALLSFVFAAGVLLGKRWGWWLESSPLYLTYCSCFS